MLLARRLHKLRRAIRLGKTYTPRTPEVREQRQRRKLHWRLVQALYRRLGTLSGKTRKQRQWDRVKARVNPTRNASRKASALAEGRAYSSRRAHLTPEQRREANRLHRHTRDVRKRKGTGRLSLGLITKLLFLQQRKCAVCQRRLQAVGPLKFHLDHIEPLALGGPHADHNMQLLCPPCNVRKGALPPIQFMQSVGKLI